MSSVQPHDRTTRRLRLARACLDRGIWTAADVLCRNVLDAEPANHAALDMIGLVASCLRNEAANPHPGAAIGPRYLLIKSWGAGFWSDVSHVVGGLVLAEMTGRVPVVCWGSNSRFGDTTGRNAFELYFEPVSQVTVADLAAIENASFFPDRWGADNLQTETNPLALDFSSRHGVIDFLNRRETVVVADFYLSVAHIPPWLPRGHPFEGRTPAELFSFAIEKYLRPVADVAAAVDEFVKREFGDAPYVAAHARGSDKVKEFRNFDRAPKAVFDRLEALKSPDRIFLMTDDQRVAQAALQRFGRALALTESIRSSSDIGPHFLPKVDGRRLGLDVMTDVYVALKADRFIGLGQSNPSSMISMMRRWPPAKCELLGASLLLRRSAFLHLPPKFAELAHPDAG